jgi:hypothetical protein
MWIYVVVVLVRFFVWSVISLMLIVEFLQLVVAYLVFLLMTV